MEVRGGLGGCSRRGHLRCADGREGWWPSSSRLPPAVLVVSFDMFSANMYVFILRMNMYVFILPIDMYCFIVIINMYVLILS